MMHCLRGGIPVKLIVVIGSHIDVGIEAAGGALSSSLWPAGGRG